MLRLDSGFSDSRAVVIPLGFILVVGVVTLSLYVFQLSAVPSMNKNAETDSHRTLRLGMQEFDSSVSRTAATGVSQTSVFKSIVDYPFQLQQPAQPDVLFSTGELINISVKNAKSTNGTSGWDGSTHVYETRPVSISAEYTQYQTAETIQYEHGIVHLAPYDSPNKTSVVIDSQPVVNGKTITLFRMVGAVSVSQRGSVPATVERDEATNVSITNTTGSNVKLTLETSLTKSQWRSLINGETTSEGGYISGFSYTSSGSTNKVTLTFEQGVTYDLRIYKMHVSTGSSESEVIASSTVK